VVAYFPDVNIAEYKAFELVAKHFQGEISFWHVHDEKMAKSLKFKQSNSIAIFKPHEKTFYLNRPSTERHTLLSQLQPFLKPLYEELTFFNTYRIWDGELPKLTALIHGFKGTLSKRTISILRALAKNYKDRFDFIVINAESYREFLRVFGIRTEELPTFTIVYPSKVSFHYLTTSHSLSLSLSLSRSHTSYLGKNGRQQ
jgi:capsule polysaccharide export protein KpsC/LpsZ